MRGAKAVHAAMEYRGDGLHVSPAKRLDHPRLLGGGGDELDMAAVVHVQRRVGQQPIHDLGVDDWDDGVIGARDDQCLLPDERTCWSTPPQPIAGADSRPGNRPSADGPRFA